MLSPLPAVPVRKFTVLQWFFTLESIPPIPHMLNVGHSRFGGNCIIAQSIVVTTQDLTALRRSTMFPARREAANEGRRSVDLTGESRPRSEIAR